MCEGANGAFRRFGRAFSVSVSLGLASAGEIICDVRPVVMGEMNGTTDGFSSEFVKIKRLLELLLSSRERCRVNVFRKDLRI